VAQENGDKIGWRMSSKVISVGGRRLFTASNIMHNVDVSVTSVQVTLRWYATRHQSRHLDYDGLEDHE
jgi:hypothetical protein